MRPAYQVLITFWLSVLASCGQKSNDRSYKIMLNGLLSHSVPEISAAGAAVDTSCVFLDARERKEFEVSHIQNARWVGYKDFDMSRMAAIPKTQSIIIYCSVGYRSEKIAEKIRAAGFTSVSNLYGGLFSWVNEGKPVYRNDQPVAEVHAYNKFWSKWLQTGTKVYD